MRRLISSFIAGCLCVSSVLSSFPAMAESSVPIDEPATEENEISYVDADDVSDKLSNTEYRDSVDIVKGKVAFAIRDVRADGAPAEYLTDSSELALKYGLSDIEMVVELKSQTAEEVKGSTSYDVYYEASISAADTWKAIEELNESGDVIYAEPDYIWKTEAVGEPTVAETESEWYLSNLEADSVWNIAEENGHRPGEGVVVAVIDTGVDYTHTDLDDNMWINAEEIPGNGKDDDGNGYIDDVYGINLIAGNGDPMDDNGHGTHVAGIIAMEAGNGGGVGLAYGAQIMAIKAGQHNGTFSSTDIAKAIKYASANGADVINMSFGGSSKSEIVEAALADAFGTCVLVASAGNNGKPTIEGSGEDIYPAGYNYVIGVMASTADKKIASFSNWDYIIGKNCEYELAAPGVDIYSTLPDNRYATWSGTSMAAPMVAAAAAIIRAEHTNKSVYTSRYIMGQLVSASDDIAYLYYSTGKDLNRYPQLDIIQSLTKQPKPDIHLNDIYLFDTDEISSVNNNDGIAQPGEIIDFGLSIWNRWGTAKNVTVSVDTKSPAGIDSPYVTVISNEITLNEIGTFSSVNNGYKYTDGVVTGVSNPFRFKIKEDTPNGAQITFNFSITAKNGLDTSDISTYSFSTKYTITVQNGYVLSGIIEDDMTLTSDRYWIIGRSVRIPKGVTVTVEPGTQIQFFPTELVNEAEFNVVLQVEGNFICNGTYDEPIEFSIGDYYVDHDIGTINIISDRGEYGNSYVELNYVICYDYGSSYNNSRIYATYIDHCKIIHKANDNIFGSTVHTFIANRISNSILDVRSDEVLGDIYNCLIAGGYIYNKDQSDQLQINRCALYFPSQYHLSNDSFKNNAILWDNEKYGGGIYTYNGSESLDISGNYWGTDNAEIVAKRVYDADDNILLNDLVQEPYLTLDSPELETIYPFVTEVFVTDSEGNRITDVVGSQTITIHVKFNRDMASDIQPMVSYGGSAPYTDYVISGDWATAREWTGEMKIDPWINQGTMYFRIKDAAAADDKWLTTGTDQARFSFNITKSTAQSMALQGNGDNNCNRLEWLQDDYDTLAGYNIYRSTSYDNTVAVTEQNFTKINSSLVDNDTATYFDKNVKVGTKYYYYFTIVQTDFKESEASNVVMCTPLDSESPVIKHTPVTEKSDNSAIKITASITDNYLVKNAYLYYKMSDAEEWQCTPMINTTGTTYQATIASYETKIGKLWYYIAATDGVSFGYCGNETVPHIISIEHIYAPSSVTGFTLAGRASNALRLNWTKNTSADGYIIEQYKSGKWVRIAKITSNTTTTYRVTGLSAGTAYKFRMKAYKTNGSTSLYSDYTPTLSARTNPSDITGFTLGGRASDALRLNWNKNTTADGYIIEQYKSGKWVRIAKITNNATATYRVSGLSAGTVYKFRMKAYKMSGSTAIYSAYTSSFAARTNPSNVTGVKIGGKASNALRVNWTKNTSASGYIVEFYKGGKWVRAVKITKNTTVTYRISGLAKNTTYKIRIKAYKMSGTTALYSGYTTISGKTTV